MIFCSFSSLQTDQNSWWKLYSPGPGCFITNKLDDGWPESEKDVFQAALGMVVKDSRWMAGEFLWAMEG